MKLCCLELDQVRNIFGFTFHLFSESSAHLKYFCMAYPLTAVFTGPIGFRVV